MIGRYRLLEQLGAGGMGMVYLAEQQQPVHRRVALKIIKPGMDSALVIARFEQERQALAMMDHPNIAKVLDAGTTQSGRPYFVMELVKGIPITRYCDQQHLSPRERLDLFMSVCRAVQHAHQKGIIHRDLKPSNVLVGLYDGQPVAKVIDFGLAKATTQKLIERTMYTEIGSIVGTIEYMAPEQAELNNLDVDTRADIYSLGVILYELLTSTPPFSAQQLRGEAFAEMLRVIREVEPQRPSTKLSSSAELPAIAANRKLEPKRLKKLLQGDLDWIVMRALEKDRSRRYETANAFAADIERFLNNEPVAAGPPSAGYRFRKFASRNRKLIAAGALILTALVASAVVSTWQALVARQANVVANRERDVATKAEQRARDDRDRAKAAEQRAQQEARRAQTEAAIAAAVNEFLREDLLGQASARKQASPTAKADPNLTVKAALDRAAERVAGKFEKQPYVEVAIRRTIGWAYRDLGDLAAAQRQFELARERLAGIRLPTDPELLDLTTDVAMMYRLLGRYAESEALCRKVLTESRRTLGEEHPITMRVVGALANALVMLGKHDEAEKLLASVLAIQKRKLGESDSQTLVTMNTLANIYKDKCQFTQALELYQHVLDARQRNLGPEHPDTLSVMNNLAIVYKLQGHFDKAGQLYEQVIEARRRILGDDHPNTLVSINNLALLRLDQARYPEAEQMLSAALETFQKKISEDHPMCLSMMDNLAELHDRQGRHDQAQALFEKVLLLRRPKLGDEHPDVLTTLHGLAIAQANSGQLAEARQSLAQVIAARRKVQGNDHPDLAAALHELGQYDLKEKRFVEAESLFRETLAIFSQQPQRNWHHFDTESLLGASLLGQQKLAEAEPLLLSGYSGMRERQATIPVHSKPLLNNAIQRLIDLYTALGNAEKADYWRRQLTTPRKDN